MSVKYGSGNGKFVGKSIIYPIPIPLEASQYFGACIVASDGQFYYSNGFDWIIPKEDVDISRPSALVPTNVDEQTQLRLSAFRSPSDILQTGALFQISTNGVDFIGATQINSTGVVSLYQLLYPDSGFNPGDTVLWRGKYLGTGDTQSDFSIPFSQVFPEIITTPVPLTAVNAITGTAIVSAYTSPTIFGISYTQTQTEIYSVGSTPGVSTPVAVVNHTNGGVTSLPSTLAVGTSYLWRTRYEGRAALGAPSIYSNWTEARTLVAGGNSMILEYDLDLATARTIYIPLGGTTVDVSINWGDGVVETFTTAGVKSHTYASGVGPTVLVSISGTLSVYGVNTNINQEGLTRVENLGFGLGLTSLFHAFRNTRPGLVYFTPNLPETVTNMHSAFFSTTSQVDLSLLNTSNVTNMRAMFQSSNYNHPGIANWDTSSVTDMGSMFTSNPAFNHPIGNWDTANVTNMASMFNGANAFNQNIGDWDVSKVTTMQSMFQTAFVFNQNIGGWDVSSVADMGNMFQSAWAFNGDISAWDTGAVTNMGGMFSSARSFNRPIGGWNTSNVTSMLLMFTSALVFNQPIGTWDVSKVTVMQSMFEGAPVFNQDIGAWNVSSCTNMGLMFKNTAAFNNGGSPSINNWNTSSLQYTNGMFQQANFNQPIGNWDMSKVLAAGLMFTSNTVFNQDISSWNLGLAANLLQMFDGATAFNQPIGNWDIRNSTNMNAMLNSASFNQSLGGWKLRRAGTIMTALGLVSVNIENWSRTLIGWANYVATTDGPYTVPVAVTATRQYNALDYITGERFTNAAAARAFLVGARAVSVTGSSDTAANTSYTYNATTLTYDAANGWYFAIVGGVRWELFDPSNVSQAVGTSTEIGSGPNIATAWTGVLSAATVLRTGATWTITGDASV